MNLLFYLALGTTLFCTFAIAASFATATADRAVQGRLLEVTRGLGRIQVQRKDDVERRLLGLIRGLRARIGMSDNPKLRERFAAAGMKSPQSVEMYFAAQMLAPVAGILIGSFITANTMFWIMALVVVGYIAPGFFLERKIKARRERIRKSLPDAIDLLVICVDAGLGMDQAMLRVGQELAVSHPEINEEFLQINREQRAGKPRLDAWKSFAARVQLPDIDGFVNMLVQTERFGTPIARALSSFADQMRLKRRQVAEEKAAKTTVKIIFPLVMFIFPCMFIILLGPALLGILHNLSALTQ